MKKILTIGMYGLSALALVFGLVAVPSSAADHLDAPGLTPPGGDTRLDITDVYAFQSPSNPDNVVLVMGVNPLAGVLNDGTFRSDAWYDFKVDLDGNASPDFSFRTTFSEPDTLLQQDVKLRLVLANRRSFTLATGETGEDIALPGGGWLRAGVFDDPFFFDLNGFLALDFCNPGSNFFAGANISAIVLEVPASDDWSNIGVWATTTVGGKQIDRMGRPAINTVFIPANVFEPTEPSQKNFFNSSFPLHDQAKFRGEVVDTLEIFYGAGSPDAQGLADFLLPDILTIDTSNPAGFPNGRGLADDVIDIELGLVTNGAVTTDCVANDSVFSTSFPYLAPPN